MIVTADDGAFYSKPLLSTALTSKRTPDMLAMFSSEQMAEQLNATVLTNKKLDAIDAENQRVVMACGAEVIRLPLGGVLSINNLQDYRVFRQQLEGKKRIAIIGAGLVGCEFANDLTITGYDVDVYALSPYPLERLVPEPVGRAVQDALEKNGVRWHLETAAEEFDADIVLSAIGLRPYITLAKAAGLKTNRGIIVDEFLQTSHENIYALGDCAEVNGLSLQYVAPLLQCARALAKTLAGEKTAVHYPPMPIVIKTPACPVAVLPPTQKGEWRYEGDAPNIRACCYDAQDQLIGFALTGECARHRAQLIKRLPDMMMENVEGMPDRKDHI